MTKGKRVYVAWAYSADNVLGVLDNIRNGIRISTEILLAGYAPFCPWCDHSFVLALREGEHISVQQFYDYSIAWLEVSDVMVLVPGWENSKGVNRERVIAMDLDIPIFEYEDFKKL